MLESMKLNLPASTSNSDTFLKAILTSLLTQLKTDSPIVFLVNSIPKLHVVVVGTIAVEVNTRSTIFISYSGIHEFIISYR